MSFQNSWQAPQSDTIEGMTWLPQTNTISSESYLPCELDDILQLLPVDQNPQLLLDPTYDSLHMSMLGWPQEDNLLSYPTMLDNATCQNAPAASANEIQPIFESISEPVSAKWHPVPEPTTEAQHTEEHPGSDSQGSALASRLERLEERVGLIEEETRYFTEIQAYIKEFQEWTVEFKRTAETLATEINDSKSKNP